MNDFWKLSSQVVFGCHFDLVGNTAGPRNPGALVCLIQQYHMANLNLGYWPAFHNSSSGKKLIKISIPDNNSYSKGSEKRIVVHLFKTVDYTKAGKFLSTTPIPMKLGSLEMSDTDWSWVGPVPQPIHSYVRRASRGQVHATSSWECARPQGSSQREAPRKSVQHASISRLERNSEVTQLNDSKREQDPSADFSGGGEWSKSGSFESQSNFESHQTLLKTKSSD